MSLEDYLPPGIGLEDLIVVMAGASALFTCLAVYTALLARAPAARGSDKHTAVARGARPTPGAARTRHSPDRFPARRQP